MFIRENRQRLQAFRRFFSLNLVLASVLATFVVVGSSSTIVSASSIPTNVTGTAGNAQVALTWSAPSSLTFPITFNGTAYTSVFIGSNTYITFGGGSGAYNGLSASNPALPGVHMCAADNSYQKVFYKINTAVTPNTMTVRYEGNNSTSGSNGFPSIVYEATFYRDQAYFDVLIGSNSRCTGGTRLITNGTTQLAAVNFTANSNWRITGGTATQNGQSASWIGSSSGTMTDATATANSFNTLFNSDADDSFVQSPAAPSGYAIEHSTNSGSTWTRFTNNTGTTSTSATVTGLTNGTSYIFRVANVINGSVGTFSTASPAYVPFGVPAAPTSLAGTRGNQQVALSWAAPTNTGGSPLTDYIVQFSSNSGSTWSTFADGTSTTASATVTGLTNGTSYVFRVAAVNTNGTGTYTSATAALVPATTPGAPGITSLDVTSGQVAIIWGAPASNGGAAITDYVIQQSSNSGSTWTTFSDGTSTSTSARVTGLTNGTTYVFRVAATNAIGTGSYSSAFGPATPITFAGAPTSVTATAGAASATVSWTAPASNGGAAITDYAIQFSSNSGSTWTTFSDGTSTSTSATVTGLTNGTSYTFRVATINQGGTGSYSTASSAVTPTTTPGAPTSVSATTGSSRATISWTAPTSNGGSSITGYAVQFSTNNGSTFATQVLTGSTSTSYTYTGLTPSTAYVFRIAAITAVGQGTWSSNTSSVTIQDLPGAPTSVTGTDGNAQVVVSWTAPTSNGGAAISDYAIQYSSNSGSTWTTFTDGVSTSTSATVTGLTNGTDYIFRVAAINTWGTGSYSSSSATRNPFTTPSAPTNVAGSPSSAQATVTWTAATANGRAVTDYIIQFSSNSGSTWSTFSDGTSTATSATITGLTNGVAYVFRVAATNSAGTSSYSTTSASATPQSVPSLPTSVAGTGGNTQVSLVWTTPSSNGGRSITDYIVQFSSNAGSTWTTFSDGTSTATSATVTGLTNGTEYVFQVAAINSVGTGSYSVASSVVIPFTVPGQPTSLSGTAGINQIDLSWTAPTSNGGAAVTDYVVEYSTNSGSTWVTFVDGVSTSTSASVIGLTNGTGYIFRVTAKNAAGNGTASATTSAIVPRTMPSAAQSVTGTAGNAQVALSWSAPVSNGGASVTDYAIQFSTDGTNWTLFTDSVSTSTSATVTGLTNGTSYVFRVAAVNSAGTGAYSIASTSVTPFTTPGTPTSVLVTRGNAQVSLSWTAPTSNGGNAIIQYRVQYAPEGGDDYSTWSSSISTLSTSTSYTVTGLTNGTSYKFRVVAANSAGNGTYSSASDAVIPFTTPGVPTSVMTTAGNAQVSLSWTAPTSNGGDAVTDYAIQYSSNLGSSWTTFSDSVSSSTSATVTGLTNGTAYVFRVAAVNTAGTGSYSSASGNVSPRTSPDAPSSVIATAGNEQVSLSWTVPAFNGGVAITDYQIEYSQNASTWTSFADGTSTLRAATVTGLTNGTAYYFRVYAVNSVGTSSASAPSSPVTPLTVPTAPTITQITTGNATLSVAFTAASDGGNPITTYQYSTDGGATWQTRTVGSTSSPLVITALSTNGTTALANGTTYSVRIRAVNSAGTGSASSSVTATPTTVPGAPTSVQSTPGSSSIDLEWTAPASNGGAAISDYVVEFSTNGGSTWTTFNDGTSSATTASVTGLTNGTQYIFRVSAKNSVGEGVASTWTTSVAPRTAPGTPSSLTLTPGSSSIAVSWTAPSSGGSTITDYIIEYSTNGSTWTTFNDGLSTSASTTISGLTNGTAYSVRVSAVNVAGTGTAVTSGSTSTPRTTPSAPSISSITAGDTELSVGFTAGADGGSAITSYQFSTNNGSTWSNASSTSSPITITGLTNGTRYQVAIRAVNIVGSGSSSNVLASTPRTTPGAPTISSVTAGANQISVAFTLANDGGSPVTNYEYRVNAASWTAWETAAATSSPLVISNLVNGTTYSLQIRAVNAAGSGTSSSTQSATPFSTPGAPSITGVSGGVREVSISFNAGVTGGATITNYAYSLDDGANWTTLSPVSITSPISVTGLSDATQYTVRLRAINIAGNGAASSSVTVRTLGVPSQPTITSANSRDRAVDVYFTAGANGGSPVTNYEYSIDGGSTWVARSSASTLSPLVISGLTNGTSYTIAIRAVNSVGSGAASSTLSVKPHTVPSAPTITAQPAVSSQTLEISFTAGSDGGDVITGYEYSTDRGATWLARTDGQTTTSPITITKESTDGITDLTNGTTYDVQIRAVNVVGSGIASTDVSGTPAAAPSDPSNLDITSGNRSLLVAFSPGSNGGAAISDYEYSTDNGSTWRSAGTTASPITILATSANGTLISNGTSYTIKVRSVNSIGAGTASAGASATPSTNPGTPSSVVATYGSGSIAVAFEEGSNGGSDITGYEYSTDGGATWRMRDVGTTMTSSPITITKLSSDGLTAISNGTAYDVAIRAVNRAGAGRESATFTVIPAGVPDVPTITAVNSSNGGLSVEFTAGNAGGRSVIRNEYSIDGGSTWIVAPTLNSPIVISGLTNGTAYALQVRQVNEVGNGSSSITVAGTPYTTPGSSTIDQISAGNATISLFFTDGATNGTQITSYEYSTDDGATWRTRRTGTIESPLTITTLSTDGTTALQNGTAYSVKIRAVNAAGSGTESESVRIAPYTVATAPVISAVQMRNSFALLTYSISSNGGAAVTGYEYSLNGGITWLNASSTTNPLRISGLVNGNSYSLILRAVNRAGSSDSSVTVSLAPVGPPDAPRINTLTPGNGTLEVAFTDGATSGSPITGYEYTLDQGVTWVAAVGATSSPFTISGLNNGTIYTVQVRAVNAQGSGTSSDPVISKPYTVPGAPVINDVVVAGNEATVAYTTPATDGGQSITSYEYSIDNGDSWVSTNSSTVMSVQITNLVEGEEYEIAVRAVNSAGAGAAATVSTQSVVENNPQPVAEAPKAKTEPVVVPVVEVPETPTPAPVTAPTKKPTSSTTPPVSEAPEFLEESRGVLTAPGKAVVIINDEVSDVVIDVTDGIAAVYVDSDTILNITMRTPSGEVVSVDGGTILHGVRGGMLEINGSGLAPNSELSVWINSEPLFLGTTMTNENGEFSASFALPEGLVEGEHTLTVGGVTAGGVNIKTSLGLVIASAPEAPADAVATDSSDGFGVAEGLLAAVLLLFMGLCVALVIRLRKSA